MLISLTAYNIPFCLVPAGCGNWTLAVSIPRRGWVSQEEVGRSGWHISRLLLPPPHPLVHLVFYVWLSAFYLLLSKIINQNTTHVANKSLKIIWVGHHPSFSTLHICRKQGSLGDQVTWLMSLLLSVKHLEEPCMKDESRLWSYEIIPHGRDHLIALLVYKDSLLLFRGVDRAASTDWQCVM